MHLCPVCRIQTIFSWTLTAGMGVITGVAYTPLFLLPSISILPMDPNGGQTGLFCILHLKDLSTNDLSAVWCKSILHSILWLNLFFPLYELETFPVVVASERGKNFHGKSGVPLAGQRCIEIRFHSASASTSLGTTLITDYVNFEHKCRFADWLARVASRSNPADQPSR